MEDKFPEEMKQLKELQELLELLELTKTQTKGIDGLIRFDTPCYKFCGIMTLIPTAKQTASSNSDKIEELQHRIEQLEKKVYKGHQPLLLELEKSIRSLNREQLKSLVDLSRLLK